MESLFKWKPLTIETPKKKNNNFQTPIWIVKYMISLIPSNCKTILEPTPGDGNIVKQLNGNYEITAPEDFFLLEHKKFDAVVMNPPFSSKYANIENAPKGINIQGMRLGYYILYKCMDEMLRAEPLAISPSFEITHVGLQKFSVIFDATIPITPRCQFSEETTITGPISFFWIWSRASR